MRQSKEDIALFDRLLSNSALSDAEKLAQAFDAMTDRFVSSSKNQMEYARALGDEEAVIKAQIKTGVMQTAREIFELCYRQVTGERGSIYNE